MTNWLDTVAKVVIDADKVGIPANDADATLGNILDLVYFFGGVVAVIVIVVAGIMYTASEGDAEKTKRAKNMILYAIVGLLMIAMAFVITGFVIGRF